MIIPITVYRTFQEIVKSMGLEQERFHAPAGFTLGAYGHVTDQMKRASAERMEGFIKDVLKL